MSRLLVSLVKGKVRVVITDGKGGVAAERDLLPADAEEIAFELLAAARRTDRYEIAACRRDQQQILTALQEVANKVARHDNHIRSIGAPARDDEFSGLHVAKEMRLLPDPVTGEILPFEVTVRLDGGSSPC